MQSSQVAVVAVTLTNFALSAVSHPPSILDTLLRQLSAILRVVSKHVVQANTLVSKSIVHAEQPGGQRTHLGKVVSVFALGSPTVAALHVVHTKGSVAEQVSQFVTVHVEIQVPTKN